MNNKIAMEQLNPSNKAGVLPGIIACVLAVAGIFSIGIVFVPLALLFLCFGLLFSILGGSGSGIGYSILGLILIIVATLASPVLLGIIGLSGLALNL